MSKMKEYKERKQRLLDFYTKIEENAVLKETLEDYIFEILKDKKRGLENEEFNVCFVGQVKTGKSTILNTLVFGEEVLPTAPTPETAKITSIVYGENPGYLVNFYNREEWENINEDIELLEKKIDGTEDYDNIEVEKSYVEEFKNQINNSSRCGVDYSSIEELDLERMPFTTNSLTILLEFVIKHNKLIGTKLQKPKQIYSSKYMYLGNNPISQLDIYNKEQIDVLDIVQLVNIILN